jgi:hypothetical protein
MENEAQPPELDDRPPAVACPHCAAHTARPVSVVTDKADPNILHVTMRCYECMQSWIVPKMGHELPA